MVAIRKIVDSYETVYKADQFANFMYISLVY